MSRFGVLKKLGRGSRRAAPLSTVASSPGMASVPKWLSTTPPLPRRTPGASLGAWSGKVPNISGMAPHPQAMNMAVAKKTAARVKLRENPIKWVDQNRGKALLYGGAIFAGGNAMKGFGGPPTGKMQNPTQQARGIYGF